MITIICGEDTVTSRQHYSSLEQGFLAQNIAIRKISQDQLSEINRWLGESTSLFSDKQIFMTQDISRKLRRNDKSSLVELEKLSANNQIEIIDWEQVSARELKIAKLGQVIEFKPKESVFKMLDALYPGNIESFVHALRAVHDGKNDQFLFLMLFRQVRQLILASENALPATVATWQAGKLKSLANRWPKEKLITFYEGLYRIEVASKTGATPFNLMEALDILICHFI